MKSSLLTAAIFALVASLPLSATAQYVSVSSPVRLVSGESEAIATEATIDQSVASTNDFPSLSLPASLASESTGEEPGSALSNEFVGPTITVGCSLVVVLGLFAGLVWITRKFGGRGMSTRTLSSDVVQSLGSTAIDARTRLTLVRCGQRILVLSQTASGIQPLAEITDRDEVAALTATCVGNSKAEFASTLRSIEQEKTKPGYLGPHSDATAATSRRQLFTTA